MKESRYNQLVKKNEQIKTEKDQLIGVYKEDKRRLRIEFDCSTIARGRRLLAELRERHETLSKEIEKKESALSTLLESYEAPA